MRNNFNVSPYFDDHDPLKNYFRILYYPERAVQARELTQVQTILQDQLASNASHIFKDGTNVTNASVSISFEQEFVQIAAVDGNNLPVTDIESFVGRTFVGETSNAVFTVDSVDVDSRRLFISTLAGNILPNENIDIDTIRDNLSPTSVSLTTIDRGVGIRANNDAGLIFANGLFIRTQEQQHVVQLDGRDGDFFVGFEYVEQIITEADDSSLLDPASGSVNANAPGGHRLQANMVLSSYSQDEEIPDTFYNFVTIENGAVVSTHNQVQYSEIVDLLAVRTFDESGDYTVKNFPLILEDDPEDNSKLNVILEPGNAYVRGYNFRTSTSTTISVNKPRTTRFVNNVNLFTQYGTFFVVENRDVDIRGTFDISRKEIVTLHSGENGTGMEITTENPVRITGIYDLNPGTRVYLSGLNDIQSVLSSVRSIKSGTKTINVATRTIVADRLTGNIEESLYGISPNPCPIFELEHTNVSDIILNETIVTQSQKSFIGFTNRVNGNFVINADDSQTDFDNSDPIISITNSLTGENLITQANAVSNIVNGGISTLTIQGLGAVSSIDVIVRTQESQANPKTKLLTLGQAAFTSDATGEFELSHSDIFQINDLYLGVDATGTRTTNFRLDNGQRDYAYENGRLTNLTPNTEYFVEYYYFAHSGTGDYFSVNSYINPTNLELFPNIYADIGSYSSESGLVNYQLTNALDYRRTISDFNSGTDLPSPESSIFVDYNYYLPRTDKVYISSEGKLGVLEGVPNDVADAPNDLPNSLTLYTLSMPGYVTDSQKVLATLNDTARYTMSDIGRLEKRIESLEYYTQLSLVENETNSLTILDDNGQNKFKNGILVDSFRDHSIGAVSDPDYLISIDEELNEMRPSFDVDSVDLISQQEFFNGPENIDIPGISVNKNTYTLDFTEVNLIEQDKASETINVNPFNVFVWYGDIQLTPPSDNWIDTEQAPSVTVSIDGNVDAFTEAANFLGTKWDSWETNWTGTTTTSQVTDRRVVSTGVDRSNWRVGPHGTWLTNFRNIATTTETTTTRKDEQSRTGQQLSVSSQWVESDLGERIIDTRIVPFIRNRIVEFEATGFKPETELRALFDMIDVTDHCTQTGPTAVAGVLKTDASGRINGEFDIPAGEFRTGTREFALIDDELNPTTQSKTDYTASGLIQTKQNQILSVETPSIEVESVSENRLVTTTSTTSSTAVTQQRGRPYDPIAQSFFIDQEGGVYVNSIEVYFRTKDENIPVSLEIVSNENGYPSIFTLPFAKRVLYPEDINISEDGTVPTKFTFTDPVYLEHLGDYSFVLKSNSANYNAFVALTGGINLEDDKIISEQPYIGSLFKSQNAFTWNADQERDMKFRINRCSFTSTTSNLFLQNNNNVTDRPFTAIMPNIDTLILENTNIDLFYQVAASGQQNLTTTGYTQVNNKTNLELLGQETFDTNSEPLRFLVGMHTNLENVSPVIHRYRNSCIVVNNFSEEDGQPNLFAGSYRSKPVTLANPADDLMTLIDVRRQPGSEIEVYYRIGDVIPRFVEFDSTETKQDSLEGITGYIYHVLLDGTVELQGSLSTTSIDDSSNRIFIKQISNIESFIEQSNFNIENISQIILTDDTEFDDQQLSEFDPATRYDQVTDNDGNPSYSRFDGRIWKSVVSNNIGLTPGTGYAWQEVAHHSLTSELRDNVRQTWQPMILDSEFDNSVDLTNFVEYSYKPLDSIREQFTQYSIRVDLRVTDPARIPTCKSLRVLALS